MLRSVKPCKKRQPSAESLIDPFLEMHEQPQQATRKALFLLIKYILSRLLAHFSLTLSKRPKTFGAANEFDSACLYGERGKPCHK
jgi:hypothetical protein